MSPAALVMVAPHRSRRALVAALARRGWRSYSTLDADASLRVLLEHDDVSAVIVRFELFYPGEAIAALVRARRVVPHALRVLLTPTPHALVTELADAAFASNARADGIARYVHRYARAHRAEEPPGHWLSERIARALSIVPPQLRDEAELAVRAIGVTDPVFSAAVCDYENATNEASARLPSLVVEHRRTDRTDSCDDPSISLSTGCP